MKSRIYRLLLLLYPEGTLINFKLRALGNKWYDIYDDNHH